MASFFGSGGISLIWHEWPLEASPSPSCKWLCLSHRVSSWLVPTDPAWILRLRGCRKRASWNHKSSLCIGSERRWACKLYGANTSSATLVPLATTGVGSDIIAWTRRQQHWHKCCWSITAVDVPLIPAVAASSRYIESWAVIFSISYKKDH